MQIPCVKAQTTVTAKIKNEVQTTHARQRRRVYVLLSTFTPQQEEHSEQHLKHTLAPTRGSKLTHLSSALTRVKFNHANLSKTTVT